MKTPSYLPHQVLSRKVLLKIFDLQVENLGKKGIVVPEEERPLDLARYARRPVVVVERYIGRHADRGSGRRGNGRHPGRHRARAADRLAVRLRAERG